MSRSSRIYGTVAAVLLALAAMAIVAETTGGLSVQDRTVLLDAVEGRSASVTPIAIELTTIGSTAVSTLAGLVVGIVLWFRRCRRESIYLVATVVSASLVFTLAKRVIDRPRPPEIYRLLHVGNESMPSGHATMSAVVATAFVLLARPHLTTAWRVVAVLLAVAWVGVVGATRIYLGVHWFSDVLTGWSLGVGWAFAGMAVLALVPAGRRDHARV